MTFYFSKFNKLFKQLLEGKNSVIIGLEMILLFNAFLNTIK